MVPSPESFFRRIFGLASLVFTWPNRLSISLPPCLSLVLAFLAWSLTFFCVAACPYAHHHFCHFHFLRMGASHWHCLHPVHHSWLNDHLVDLSFNMLDSAAVGLLESTLLSHMTPDFFLQLFCRVFDTRVYVYKKPFNASSCG